MKNIEKKNSDHFKEFIYNRVSKTPSIRLLYALIVISNFLGDFSLLYEHIQPGTLKGMGIDSQSCFYFTLALLGQFMLLTLLSFLKDLPKMIWLYSLMLLEAFGSIFIANAISCLTDKEKLCVEDVKIKSMTVVACVFYGLAMIVFRNFAYYPFYSIENLFSMRQCYMSVCLLIYRILVGFAQGSDLFSSNSAKIRILLLLSIFIFMKSRRSGYINQFSRRVWNIYYFIIVWSYVILFVSSHGGIISQIGTQTSKPIPSHSTIFWYLWGYTIPFIILMAMFEGRNISDQSWRSLFDASDHVLTREYSLSNIFLICNQYYLQLQMIKKCEMKYKDEKFKQLWELIQLHNRGCCDVDCPLKQLEEIKNLSDDDYLEQKRFIKAVQACLEYGQQILQKLKESEPNQFELNIEISCYCLHALRDKQTGMKLIQEMSNQQKQLESGQDDGLEMENIANVSQNEQRKKQKFTHKELNYANLFSTYYLKKKIDEIFVGQERLAQSNVDDQISEFKQKVEISVTMLAQFWSFLADLKCNLKKLYELTNVLFPLKRSVEEDWERIKQLKNIDSYNFYAKYLIKMFNDKEKGVKILEEAKKIQYQQKNREQIQLSNKMADLVQQNGVIFLQFDGKNSGVIFQTNINAQKIFGYNRGELIDRKVNEIMPGVYAQYHDRILEHYQQTNQSTMMNKERHIWGKSKDGHIFQFIILIKPILNFYSQASSSEVYASIKRQVYIKEVIGIVVDSNDQVREISSTAYNLFPFLKQQTAEPGKKRNLIANSSSSNTHNKSNSLKNISEKMIPATVLFPDFAQIKEKVLLHNQHHEVQVVREVKERVTSEAVYEEICLFTIQISQIRIKIAGNIGYIIKLTKSSQSVYRHPNQQLPQEIKEKPKTRKKRYSVSSVSSFHKEKEKREEKKQLEKVHFKINHEEDSSRKFMFSFNAFDKKNLIDLKKEEIDQEEFSSNKSKKRKSVFNYSLKNLNISKEEKKNDGDMKFIGGYFKFGKTIQSFFQSSVQNFKARLRLMEFDEELQKVSYAKDIKTKRLFENQIREMREEEDSLKFGGVNPPEGIQEEEEQEENKLVLKPSQLSMILEKQPKNTLVTNLKILTIFLVIISCGMSIGEHLIELSYEDKILEQLQKTKQVNQMKAEALYIKEFLVYLSQYPENKYFSMDLLRSQINELDEYLDYFQFSQDTDLVYSDKTKDRYYLGFALSKLVSEANSIEKNPLTQLTPGTHEASNVFFINYNMVNGIQIALIKQQKYFWNRLEETFVLVKNAYIAFIIATCSIFGALLLAKNCVFKAVMNKKAEILQNFFQIPRRSCSQIQKQCQKFIINLSAEVEDEELDFEELEDIENSSLKRGNVQKKRQIIGQEKTAFTFILATLFFMLALVFFQLFVFVSNMVVEQNTKLSLDTCLEFYRLESKFSTLSNFMTSYVMDPDLPINGSFQHLKVIKDSQIEVDAQIMAIRGNYYKVRTFLSDEFSGVSEKILYKNYCSMKEITCLDEPEFPEETKGMNTLIVKYIFFLKQKYYSLQTNNNPQEILSEQTLKKIKWLQLTFKYHWRVLTKSISTAMDYEFSSKQNIRLWVLVSICLLNLTVILALWWKYYRELQEKMIATEYILTFIPLNEINKNPKIALYIKQKILKK